MNDLLFQRYSETGPLGDGTIFAHFTHGYSYYPLLYTILIRIRYYTLFLLYPHPSVAKERRHYEKQVLLIIECKDN
jgi:hypothetical protein